jgi:hypothetical protein
MERVTPIFPIPKFLSEFPEFNTDFFTKSMVARCGKFAMKYITQGIMGYPLSDPDDREYALFLMAAHILTLRKQAADDMAGGSTPSGGRIRKAVVGAVTVETDSPNSYTTDDYAYWLSQTTYGQELLAYLNNAAPAGIYLNTKKDSVRVI